MAQSLISDVTAEDAARFVGRERYYEACARDLAEWFGIGPMPVEKHAARDYAEAGNLLPIKLRVDAEFLAPIATAFLANVDRVHALHALPLQLIYTVMRGTKNSCAAAADLGIPVANALDPALATDQNFQSKRARIESEESDADQQRAHATGISVRAYNGALGSNHLNRLIQNQQKHTSSRDAFVIGGIESNLFSMVLLSYAAFETLATDLWVATLNKHPDPLAVAWCNTRKNPKKYDLKELASFKFNVSGAIGSFLLEQEQANFQNLLAIKDNYVSAFGRGAQSCFEPEDPLYLLWKVRNLIAHRGGIIDAQFKAETAKFSEYASQNLGQHLLLNGANVRELVMAGFTAGKSLFSFVDNWAAANAG